MARTSYPKNDNSKRRVKHSGAKMKIYVPTQGANAGSNQIIVNGWKLAGKDLIKVTAVTTSKSVLSPKGWIGSVAVNFVNTNTGETNFHWGTMEKSTGKVVVDKMAFVMNPKAPNGGYCGTFVRSKKSY